MAKTRLHPAGLFAFALSFSAIVAVTAGSCGPPPCDSRSCSGCCLPNGRCEAGSIPSACGANGSACQACGPQQVCSAGMCLGGGGGGGGGKTDGGGAADAGQTTDGGTTASDGGLADGGTTTTDGGTPDGGATGDGGTSGSDAGVDGGTGGVDAGTLKPNVMLLLDKSASMASKLADLKAAFGAWLPPRATSARFGLAFVNMATTGSSVEQACVPGQVILDIASSDAEATLAAHSAQIDQLVQSIGGTTYPVVGGAPLADTAPLFATLPSLKAPGRRNGVLLVLDGMPNCNAAQDPTTCLCSSGSSPTCGIAHNCDDSARAAQRVADLRAAGVPVALVGFGADVLGTARAPLSTIAKAGGLARRCTDGCGADPCAVDGYCDPAFYTSPNAADALEAAYQVLTR